jgi:hypothetical protein
MVNISAESRITAPHAAKIVRKANNSSPRRVSFSQEFPMPLRCPLILIVILATSVHAAQPRDKVQGNWLGTWEGTGGMGGKNVCQIYGLGNGEYQAMFTAYDSGEQDKGDFTFGIRGASTTDGKVVFDQNIDLGGLGVFKFHAEIADGKLLGAYSNGNQFEGSMELKRITQAPEAVGGKPLPGAVVLFNGKDLDGWKVLGDEPAEWTVVDGAIVAPASDRLTPPKSGHLACETKFGRAQVHVEFRVPYLPEKRGERRGQSGMYLLGKYEVQIVDSFGFPRAKDVQGYFIDTDALGAIYGQQAPTELPALPPEEWQAFDITLIPETVDGDGKATKPAELTVFLNGKSIHERVELKKPTQGAPVTDASTAASLILQNAGQPVEFRNIWYVPLEAAK